ncbi:MAG: putative bifunctional diguanylate cyclase/phosphodiesterase [Solirubrobacteraceae bacterium]
MAKGVIDMPLTRDSDLRLAHDETVRLRTLVASHNRLHELIARDAPLRDVLTELAVGIEEYEPSVSACVVLLDRKSSTLHPGAGPSLPPHWLQAIDGVVIGPNIGSCGSAAWSGELVISADMGADPKWAPIREFAESCGLRHCWSMPIKGADGLVLGTFALYGSQPRAPGPEHITLLEDGARLAGIAIERRRTMERLIQDARYDGLTGLPNRRAIFERMELALSRAQGASKVAALFVDLDGLKLLNDTLGHDRADEVIREIAQRLHPALRAEDFVGRFGGDEFVAVAEGIADPDDAAALATRLLEVTSAPLRGLGGTAVTASVGIALVDADVDAPEAIRRADTAMYRAKHAGRDQYAFFAARQEPQPERRRVALARDLRQAETRQEMSLAFQPVFDLATRQIVAIEALSRWTSPVHGEVSPREFIPLAENAGTIVPLGAWALRDSCETAVRVAELTGRRLELAVNVSGHQLAKPGFAQSVHQTLAHAGLPAELLSLEVAEAALSQDDELTVRSLDELRALGVQLTIDDFGLGNASLLGLGRRPIDAIKLDRRFLAGLPDDEVSFAVVAAMSAMGTALSATVTAKGVETEAQLVSLSAMGCTRVQGFLLAEPMGARNLVARLRGQAG